MVEQAPRTMVSWWTREKMSSKKRKQRSWRQRRSWDKRETRKMSWKKKKKASRRERSWREKRKLRNGKRPVALPRRLELDHLVLRDISKMILGIRSWESQLAVVEWRVKELILEAVQMWAETGLDEEQGVGAVEGPGAEAVLQGLGK